MKKFLPPIFWAGVLLVFLTPMELGDIWWHLSTGKWIVESRGLPGADPFSYVESADGGLILKGYWLCQIFLYAVWLYAGLPGLICVKAVTFASIFYVLLRFLKGCAIGSPWSYILLLPGIVIATSYDEIRPQSFTFLFFSLALFILERGRDSGRASALWPLPPLMLLWSNTHPEFIVGDALIALYAGEALFLSNPDRQASRRRAFLLLLSIAASALNPNALAAFAKTAELLGETMRSSFPSHEYLPPGRFAALTGQRHLYPALISLLSIGAAGFILRLARKGGVDILQLLLFVSLSYFSLKTFRAGMFAAMLTVAVTGKNLSATPMPDLAGTFEKAGALRPKFLRPFLFPLVAAAVFLATAFSLVPRSALMRPLMSKNIFPEKAISFIRQEGLPANLYHPYELGGFLIWRLYPGYKVFTDGRAITPFSYYNDVLHARPSWRQTLERHGVNTVLYWPLMPLSGEAPPVVMALLKDEGWSPVYWDFQSVVFTRTPLAKRPLSREAIWELLIMLIRANIGKSPEVALHYSALGEVYLNRGQRPEAKAAFIEALRLNPKDKKATFWLRRID